MLSALKHLLRHRSDGWQEIFVHVVDINENALPRAHLCSLKHRHHVSRGDDGKAAGSAWVI